MRSVGALAVLVSIALSSRVRSAPQDEACEGHGEAAPGSFLKTEGPGVEAAPGSFLQEQAEGRESPVKSSTRTQSLNPPEEASAGSPFNVLQPLGAAAGAAFESLKNVPEALGNVGEAVGDAALMPVEAVANVVGDLLATKDPSRITAARERMVEKVRRDPSEALAASEVFTHEAMAIASETWDEIAERNKLPKLAVLLAGSGGRYEMSAFSDLEYLVALGSPEPCDKALLKKVEKSLATFRKALGHRGLMSDAINQPNSLKGSLACSPAALMKLLWGGDEVTRTMVMETALLAGDSDVFLEVREMVQSLLAAPAAKQAPSAPTRRLRDEMGAFKGTVNAFLRERTKGPWSWLEKATEATQNRIRSGMPVAFNVKSLLYRPLQLTVAEAARMAGRNELRPNAYNAAVNLEVLVTKKFWPPGFAKQVKEALNTVIGVRTLAHAAAQNEADEVCFECDEPNVFRVPDELHERLRNALTVTECVLNSDAKYPPNKCY